MKPHIILALSFVVACANGGSDSSDLDGSVTSDASAKTPDASSSSADASNTTCSMTAQLVPTFTNLDASGNGFDDNPLDVEVVGKISDLVTLYFTSSNAETVPLGKHQMQGQWLDGNCTFCLFLNSIDPVAKEYHMWFPIEGEIDITSVANNFVMTGTNVRFQHVKFVGNTQNVEPASDCTSLFTSFSINTPMQVGAPN